MSIGFVRGVRDVGGSIFEPGTSAPPRVGEVVARSNIFFSLKPRTLRTLRTISKAYALVPFAFFPDARTAQIGRRGVQNR
jgi:hypothetical protein